MDQYRRFALQLIVTMCVFLNPTAAQWVETSMNRNVTSLSSSGPYLFAGTNGNGVFRTIDCTNWDPVNTGLSAQNGHIWIFALQPGGRFLFAAADDAVYRSSDYGTSWSRVLPGIRALCLATMHQTVVAGSYGGIYISADQGSVWNRVDLAMDPGTAVTSLLLTESTIWAGTTLDGVFRSTNAGKDWIAINRGLPFSNTIFPRVSSLTARQSSVYAGTYGGVFVSDAFDSTWTPINSGLGAIEVSTLLTFANRIFAGTSAFGPHGTTMPGNGVYLLVDTTCSWSSVSPLGPVRTVNSLAVRDEDLYMAVEPFLDLPTLWRRPLSEMIQLKPNTSTVVGPPTSFHLYQNYPNPFNATTTIECDLPNETHVLLELFNILGERVGTVINSTTQAGHHLFRLHANSLPTGVYFYRITAGVHIDTKKLLIVR